MDNETLFAMIEEQERQLQFTEFTSETALKIGLALVEKAKKNGKVITIDIEKHGHKLFHYSFDGTSPDNDIWVEGKIRLVKRFYRSSLYMAKQMRGSGKPNLAEFGGYLAGGAFPIIIKNVGVIGTVTVSGLSEEDDHGYAADAIREYLGK